MRNWTEVEKRIIEGDEDLVVVFSPEADKLLVEVERVAKKLGVDPDELLDFLRGRRLGEWDEYLDDLVRWEEDENVERSDL